MNRDDIIKLAREAGMCVGTNLSGVVLVGSPAEIGLAHLTIEELERFAALVAAAEHEKVAAWMMQRGFATGHGDTVDDLLNELEWQVAEREREACEKVAEQELLNTSMLTSMPPKSSAAWNILQGIRARGNT